MTTKRKRGSVIRYRAGFRAYYSAPDGTRPNKVFKTEDEADRWLTARLAEVDRGDYISLTNITFRSWAKEWLSLYVEPSVRIRTTENYHRTLRKHCEPLKDMPMADIKPLDIQRLYSQLKDNGMAGSSMQRLHAMLRRLFSKAFANELIKKDIMLSVQRPKADPPEINFLSPEEIQQFLKAAEGEVCEIMIWISAYTGMRLSEVRALTWDNASLDLENGQIHVTKALYHNKVDGWMIVEPKTKSGIRTLPIPTPLLEKLKQYRATWKPNPWDLVTVGKHRKPIPSSSVALAIRRICKKANVKITFHGLRHSVASMLVSANVGISDVAALLGHANATTTLNRYSHAKKNALKDAADKIGEILN